MECINCRWFINGCCEFPRNECPYLDEEDD